MNLKKPVAPFVRSPYNYDMNEASDQHGLKCEDKSLAQQHMADECDINKLVERFVVRGEIPTLALPPLQGDFTEAPTYQEALNLMVEAQKSFMALPADVRGRFQNDPGQFVEFCSNEGNRDELRRMGLWSPEAAARFDAQQKEAQDLITEGKAARAAKKPPAKGGEGGETSSNT